MNRIGLTGVNGAWKIHNEADYFVNKLKTFIKKKLKRVRRQSPEQLDNSVPKGQGH